MSPLTEIAYAKINLALHVRRRREDGYHALETLFVFADQGDVLTAEAADVLTLEIIGPFGNSLLANDDNLVLRAARALQNKGQGARLILVKNLPITSGIGGGSADAAAALRLLAKLWGAEADLSPIAASLGADVPACLFSETLWGEGIGDRLKPWKGGDFAMLPVLLVNPGVACPTGPIFAGWDAVDRGPLNPALWMEARNDLEAPAIRLVPQITEVLRSLRHQQGLQLARMSGSGATCFGLFETTAQRDAACAMIAMKHPHWWTMAAALR